MMLLDLNLELMVKFAYIKHTTDFEKVSDHVSMYLFHAYWPLSLINYNTIRAVETYLSLPSIVLGLIL